MNEQIKILFFDVDGTLVGPNRPTLDGSTLDALNRARAQGIKLVISTGRTPQGLGILDHFTFDAYATMNGQVCYDAFGTMIRLNPVPKADIERLIGILEKDPFACCFVELEREYLNMLSDQALAQYKQVNRAAPPIGDVNEALEHDIYQMNFFTTQAHEAQVLAQLPGVTARRWGMQHSDIFALSNGKRDGIEAILKHYNLKKQNAMSFGDGENDIEMFEATALSVAMGNASPEVKANATLTTSRYDEDGIARALAETGVLR